MTWAATRRQVIASLSTLLPQLSCVRTKTSDSAGEQREGLRGYRLVYIESEDPQRLIDEHGEPIVLRSSNFGVMKGRLLIGVTSDGGTAIVYASRPPRIDFVDLLTTTRISTPPPGSPVRDCRLSLDRSSIAVLVDFQEKGEMWPGLFFQRRPDLAWTRLDNYRDRTQTPLRIGITRDGSAVVCSLGNRCVLYETQSGKKRDVAAGSYGSLSPYGDRVAVVNASRRLELIALEGAARNREIDIRSVDGVEWAPDGRHAVAITWNLRHFFGPLGDNDIGVIDMDRGDGRRLARHSAMMGVLALRWMVADDAAVQTLRGA
jgi:hypothetical protein